MYMSTLYTALGKENIGIAELRREPLLLALRKQG